MLCILFITTLLEILIILSPFETTTCSPSSPMHLLLNSNIIAPAVALVTIR
jgi:hypothetical protein